MKSKIVKSVLIFVAGGAILFGGLKFKQHLDFNANETEIRRLLTHAESRGFITNGDKFVVKRPDEQNAWIEIGQILQKRDPSKKNQPAFDNQYAGTLLNRAEISDIGLIDSAVALNKTDRERIIEVLNKKGHLQIPFNFNQGYLMLYDQMMPLRMLVNDICLMALSHGYKRDSAAAIANLEAAYLIGSELMAQRDTIPRLAGTVIYQTISKTALRIIEFDPSMIHPLKQLNEKWSPLFDEDPFDDYKWIFLEHLAACRNFDSPEMDRPVPFFPLDKFVKRPNIEDGEKANEIRPGDYLPNSYNMRKYMLTTLQQWMPIFDIVSDPKSKRDSTTNKSILDQINWETDCPPPLKTIFASLLTEKDKDVEMPFAASYLDLNREMFRQLEYKQAYGTFAPKLFTTIRSFHQTDKFSISPRGKGIQIGAGVLDSDGLHKVRVCFPYSGGLTAATYSKTMSKLRDGSLKVNAPSNTPPMISP